MRASTIPNLSWTILARGARQLVVHEALETTFWLGSYESRLTPVRDQARLKQLQSASRANHLPHTYMGASAEGAEMMTFLAPPFK